MGNFLQRCPNYRRDSGFTLILLEALASGFPTAVGTAIHAPFFSSTRHCAERSDKAISLSYSFIQSI
jgi:hypothetical protein